MVSDLIIFLLIDLDISETAFLEKINMCFLYVLYFFESPVGALLIAISNCIGLLCLTINLFLY